MVKNWSKNVKNWINRVHSHLTPTKRLKWNFTFSKVNPRAYYWYGLSFPYYIFSFNLLHANNNRFKCLVKSHSVKLETSQTMILRFTKIISVSLDKSSVQDPWSEPVQEEAMFLAWVVGQKMRVSRFEAKVVITK